MAATIKLVNAAITRAGIPLELVRGEGYHYFVYGNPERGVYETLSIYVPYTNIYTVAEWVYEAENALQVIHQILNATPEETGK